MKKTIPSIQFKRKRSTGMRPEVASTVPTAAAAPAPRVSPRAAVAPAPRRKAPRAAPAAANRASAPMDDQLPELKRRLMNAFPKAFGDIRPLKVGIHKDIWQRMPEVDHTVLDKLLSIYTRETDYLQALANGGHRFDLDGQVVESVSDYARNVSTQRLNTTQRRRP